MKKRKQKGRLEKRTKSFKSLLAVIEQLDLFTPKERVAYPGVPKMEANAFYDATRAVRKAFYSINFN